MMVFSGSTSCVNAIGKDIRWRDTMLVPMYFEAIRRNACDAS